MTVVRVKGFQIFKDRHGRLRCYHRKTRTPVDLTKAPIGSPEFIAECARIAALADAKALKEKPGTLGLLICDYRKSPVFQDLASQTQFDYQKIFDYLRPIADTPLVRFDRPLVVRIRDKAAASKWRRFGNYVKAVLSLLFGWGRERGYLADNPASGIKDIRRQKGTPEAEQALERSRARCRARRCAAAYPAGHSSYDVHGLGAERRAHIAAQLRQER